MAEIEFETLSNLQLFDILPSMQTDEPVTISATKLRQDLSVVLDAVLTGQTYLVERNRRALCVLVPAAVYAELVARPPAPPK